MINQEIRKCMDCIWYDLWPEDYNVGRCRLFDSVDPIKRDPYSGGVNSQGPCRYGLLVETIGTETKITPAEIAEIVNRAPETLRGKVTASDITINFV